jgi:hypothetical protein
MYITYIIYMDYKYNPKCGNMEGIVLALIALRKEFRPLQKPSAEPEFKPFDLSALARRYASKTWCRIILNGSVQAVLGIPGFTAYAAAEGGIRTNDSKFGF